MYVRVCKIASVKVTFKYLHHRCVVGICDGTFISNISLSFSNFQLLDSEVYVSERHGIRKGKRDAKGRRRSFKWVT